MTQRFRHVPCQEREANTPEDQEWDIDNKIEFRREVMADMEKRGEDKRDESED